MTKLTTMQQVAAMRIGDTLSCLSGRNGAQDTPEVHPAKDTDTYEIRSINNNNEMIGLVMSGSSVVPYMLPGDIGRLFISRANMVQEDIWWLA